MKKVGIVTMVDNDNYGNRLQNYATYFTYKKLGVQPITIINDRRLNNEFSLTQMIKKRISYYCHKIVKCRTKNEKQRLKRFKEFNKNIRFTKICHSINTVKLLNCDYYIVGSDQVWKPTYGRLSDMDLLSFAEPNKRISYSASFGISELPDNHKERTAKELSNFKAISVREDAGKKIVDELLNKKTAEVLVDPTMLLTSDEWDEVAVRPKQLDNLPKEKYILNYFLGELSEKRKKEIEKFAKENDCSIINILDKNDPFYMTGPAEFLYLENNAFIICTDSFHSSVFAILYSTPFIVFEREDNRVNMNSRIETLVSKFKLENHKFNGKITKDNLDNNYEKAHKILNDERNKSFDFLKKSLNI